MLHSAKNLIGFTVHGTDGEVGSVDDVYFDDERWVVRYLVVDTGTWLTGRKVLLSPLSFRQADWDGGTILMNLTQEQIRNSPGIDTHMPVSRQQERELFGHYGYPYYWTGPYAWGFSVEPSLIAEREREDVIANEMREEMAESDDDPHLRSRNEVVGYTIHATDDTLGHVEDLLFDEEDWSIQLIVIDPRNWWPGKHVMVSPQRISSVNWEDKSVTVGMSRAEIESSPEYDPGNPPLSRPPAMTRDAAGPLRRM
ncbi:MAG TPA: PRC-barrel domain-containing protein [Noviherbaspirillum sp.]|nr:PRC-barrel domain-containing protein [Noviherbaspirillum sp.]